ncbi:MAG: SRPBCC family protein [Microthrixaceae bacterium]
MAHDLEAHVVIDRPPAQVWPCVAELELDRRWRQPFVTDLRADGDPLAVGTRITGTTRAFGQSDTYTNEITTVDPPRLLAWRGLDASGGLVGVRGAYELVPHAGGRTRFGLSMTYEARTVVGRLVAPVMMTFLRRIVAPRFMRQIRELAESGVPEQHPRPAEVDA